MRTDACPWWAPPLLAIQFLTRLPVPGIARLPSPAVQIGMARAVGWFPLVGTAIGLCTALLFAGAGRLWTAPVAVVLALVVEARLTGGLHEDAVADFCDGFGGGRTAEDVRHILKDSRVGSYGALGLIFAVGLRVTCMVNLPSATAIGAIVAAATLGRSCAVAVMAIVPPASEGSGIAKDIAGGIRRRNIVLAMVSTLPGVALMAMRAPAATAAALGALTFFLAWFCGLLTRRLGGSTGDCMGFAAYAGQLLVLLAATARLG